MESDDESEISETELAARAHKEMMEEGGFTQIKEDDFGAIKRVKGREKNGTIMKGITLEDLREKEGLKRQKVDESKEANAGKYVSNKDKREEMKQDFYKFQRKIAMKSSLEELRAGFEKDKKRLEKALRKEKH